MEIENEGELKETYFQLSTKVVTSQFSPQTLKFKSVIIGFPVLVLVETGSTHNIMQPRTAHHLNLKATPITQFSVMVGDDSHLYYDGICIDVKLVIQNKPFNLPFYLLLIEGTDVVLGMAWLCNRGPIHYDFSFLSITFNHQDQPMNLKGGPKSHPTSTTFHQFRQLLNTDSIASIHLMIFQPMDSTHLPNNTKTQPLDNLPSDLPY